jgi:hypothetical protein
VKKRDREFDKEPCPRCRAAQGQRCKNYLGVTKQPCRIADGTPAAGRRRKDHKIYRDGVKDGDLFAPRGPDAPP